MPQTYFPVLLGLGLALAVGSILILVSWAAGGKQGGKIKLSTYESGMPLLDKAQKRLSVAFFLVALDFVIFDVEAAFLYPWALVVRQGGWGLLLAVGVFFALLVVGFVYVAKGGPGVSVRGASPTGADDDAARPRRQATKPVPPLPAPST